MELADLKVTRYDVRDRVGTVTLNRPDRLNAWTGRMHAEYRALLSHAAAFQRAAEGHPMQAEFDHAVEAGTLHLTRYATLD